MSIVIKNRIIDLTCRVDAIKRELEALTIELNAGPPVEAPEPVKRTRRTKEQMEADNAKSEGSEV